MRKKCTMISLDSSTSCTGYAVWENGCLKEHGTITLTDKEKKSDTPNHILMYGKIEALFKEKKPDIIVPELTNKPNNASTQRKLDRILGFMELYASQKHSFYYEMNNSTCRKVIRENILPLKLEKDKPARPQWKEWSIKAVHKFFGIDVNDDESDALLIGVAYILMFGEENEAGKLLTNAFRNGRKE